MNKIPAPESGRNREAQCECEDASHTENADALMRQILTQREKVMAEVARLQQLEGAGTDEHARRVTFILQWATDVATAAALGDRSPAWVCERVWRTIQESEEIGDQKNQGPARRAIAEMIVSAAVAYQRKRDEDLTRRLKRSWLDLICMSLAERLLPVGGPDELCEEPWPLHDWLGAWSPEAKGKVGKKGVATIMAEIAARYRAFNLARARDVSQVEDLTEKHRKNIDKSLKDCGFSEVAYASLLKQ